MNFIKNEIEKNWHQVIINSREGYLDLDELKSRLRGAIIRKKVSQKYIDKYKNNKNNKSEYPIEEIVRNENVIKEEEEYIQFLEKEFTYFPPLPVLPPTRPLIKISGVIEEVTFTKAMACFEATAYSTVQEEIERKRQQDNIGAALAMIAQSMTDSPAHALVNDGKPEKLKCLHVKGKINGKQFSGWFGMTNIRPGDYVEMAVMPEGDNYLVYAIANPEQRTVSFVPKCDMGKNTVKLKQGIIIWTVIFIIPYLSMTLSSPEYWLNLTLSFAFLTLSLSFFVLWQVRKKNKPIMLIYNELCDTLKLSEYKKTSLRTSKKNNIKK